MESLAPTTAREWKGKKSQQGTELLLPSENVALVRQMSPQAFLSSGMIPDPLTAMITKAINSKRGLPPSAINDLSDDPKKLVEALLMVDRVVCHVVVQPTVEMPPVCVTCGEYANADQHEQPSHPEYHKYQEGDRDPDVLYADELDMEDKMFIFQWCLGGVRDLETFRQQLSSGVAASPERKDVRSKAKRTPRSR